MRKFIYAPAIDEPISMIDVADGNKIYYYHFDGLGSVIALSDVNSAIVERYSYDVFGEPNRTSDYNNPYMFTGRRFDPNTGLYYYRARYYDSYTGRFLQPDPIVSDLNLYRYCFNNPLNLVDPSGEGVYKWLYTGDWNASDEVYNEAVDAAARFLLEVSPARGGYASVGKGDSAGGSLTGSWTMDSGFGVTGRYRLRIRLGQTQVGVEGGRSWNQESGYARTGQFVIGYSNVHGKLDEKKNIKLGIHYGVGSCGLIIDPSKFDDLIAEWREMLGWKTRCKK